MPAEPTPGRAALGSMGYQPSLDGLRAVSIIGVIFYHAGFSWMHGGFLGVEVFFVVSGFLITSLLLAEFERRDRIDFGRFWMRRVRRLFPALFTMLAAVAVWAVFAGSDEQRSQLQRDLPWAIFYVGNWGQILGDVPYFAGEPPLLRNLWSLAVEEQWYLIWPLLFSVLVAFIPSRRRVGALVIGASVAVMLFTAWLWSGAPNLLGGPPGAFQGLDRTNFLYLSTITRSSGLLLGAGAAFLWRPWTWARAAEAPAGRVLDPLGAAAVAALCCTFTVAVLTQGYVYQWLLPLVSVLSLVAVLVAVHPAAHGFRRMMSYGPLVEVGKRSYGLYLWSWPIFVIVEATHGDVGRFVLAMAVTVVVAELSYRYIETPVRQGALGRWWRDRAPVTYAPLAGGALLLGCLVAFYASVGRFDRFAGGEEATFQLGAVEAAARDDAVSAATTTAATASSDVAPTSSTAASGATASSAIVGSTTAVSTTAGSTTAASATTSTSAAAAASATLAIVGDSQANALAINLPSGIEAAFPRVVNGSVDGCGVLDSGHVQSAVAFRNNFAICDGWQQKWADAASGVDVALVVVGAWDVFDVVDGDQRYAFGTPDGDQHFASGLRSGIDAMLAEGTNVGLLEVACMRPVDVKGAGVRALPERGDDARVAHLNEVMRSVAAGYGPEVQVIEGPHEWCNDEAIATDLGYRWDGVHVYKPGANLIMETIAPQLLSLAAIP
jgi:peptidoglycan/LPS O-acetylase OafA/YrhL